MKALLLSMCCTALMLTASAAGAAKPMKPSGAMEAVMDNDLKDFYETAASANLFEIKAGELAQRKAGDPAVKEYAAMIIKDHTKAGAELKKIAAEKGVTLSTTLLKRHQKMYDHLRNEEPGEEFDEAFRTAMLASHKEAVSLFDQTAQKSTDSDIKEFAAKTLPKLQDHGGMAKDLPED